MRILIAEDDLTSRNMLAGMLLKYGHEVVVAVNGVEAWDAIHQSDVPDMVILDWMMPEMDGIDVVRRVRSLQTELSPYIIMLTAKGGKNDIIAGLNAGANDYLSKPFDSGELLARIEVGRRTVEMQAALIESKKVLAYQAAYDPLMGLLNRRAILDRLGKEIARTVRVGGVLTVGMCDIDHFKQVNDTYGHQTGDDVLCGLAHILSENLRTYDFVGRMGGEEFLLIAPMETHMDYLSIFARLCEKVAQSKITTRSGVLAITVSIGVACVDAEITVDEILEAADAAMYQAKNDGRNRMVGTYMTKTTGGR
jgi:diguanylate cyclase (GGDEF)-like protein